MISASCLGNLSLGFEFIKETPLLVQLLLNLYLVHPECMTVMTGHPPADPGKEPCELVPQKTAAVTMKMQGMCGGILLIQMYM